MFQRRFVRDFLQVFASVFSVFLGFGMRLDPFGCVQMRSEISEEFWYQMFLNWRFSDVFGCIRMHSEVFGSFRKFSDSFENLLEMLRICQTCAYQNYSNLLVSRSSAGAV